MRPDMSGWTTRKRNRKSAGVQISTGWSCWPKPARRGGISLLNFSSDPVFTGRTDRPIRQETHPREARRPAFSALASERGNLLMPLQQALQEYIYKRETLART